MASKKRWVVFGAGEHANKALIGFKGRLRGVEVKVCELQDKHYERGDVPDIDDISAEYITLYFTKKESLESAIHFLEGCKKFFEEEEHGDNDQNK